MSSTLNIVSTIERLTTDSAARADLTPEERRALAALHDALTAITAQRPKPGEPAPRADGALNSGDRSVGDTPTGWREEDPALPPAFPFIAPGGRMIRSAHEAREVVDGYNATRDGRSPRSPEPQWVEELRTRLREAA